MKYQTQKISIIEHEVPIDPHNCFLRSKYDYCNRDVHPYFAQFKKDNTVYTIEMSNESWAWEVKFQMRDNHSSSFEINVRKWIEKYRGQFKVISEDEFFGHYNKVLKIISNQKKAVWGRSPMLVDNIS